MKTMRFQEYMNSRGKIDKPVVKLDGDRIDPTDMPNKPPQGGKNYSVKDGKSKKTNKGFGDEGDSDLKYNPKVDNNSKGKSPAKLLTVDEITMTSKMSNAIAENPMLIETFVRQLKSNGLLGVLVAEMLNHKETFNQISEVMAHASYGPDFCKKLVRSMTEEVASPFSDQLDLEDEEEDDEFNTDGLDLEDDDDLGLDDESEEDPSMEDDPNMEEDPSMEDPNMEDPSMDPSMQGMDPSMMGMDPSMQGMDPSMMGQMNPAMMQGNPAMQNFQKAMMRSFMRQMMGKH
jgi:hypothetical protein